MRGAGAEPGARGGCVWPEVKTKKAKAPAATVQGIQGFIESAAPPTGYHATAQWLLPALQLTEARLLVRPRSRVRKAADKELADHMKLATGSHSEAVAPPCQHSRDLPVER